MILKDIYSTLDSISPFELQESWDNSGLVVGSFDDNIEHIVLSIDADIDLVKSLKPHTLLITHHPLIFSAIKRLDFSSYPSNILKLLIKKEISNIAMHTNFDKSHLNKFVATDIIKAKQITQDGAIVYFECNCTLRELCATVQSALSLPDLKCVDAKKRIRRVALITGSGASMYDQVDADCLLTGDIKYHDAMAALSVGLSMIEIGHFQSERFFADALDIELKKVQLLAIISSSKDPFSYGQS